MRLDRPPAERAREYRYWFGQGVVFGLPVIALQLFGRSLGGPEADRWVGLFQALLAGWAVYVGATGMLFEGVLWLARRRLTVDFVLSLVVAALYLAGLFRAGMVLLGISPPLPGLLHWAVLVLVTWVGLRWYWVNTGCIRTAKTIARPSEARAGN